MSRFDGGPFAAPINRLSGGALLGVIACVLFVLAIAVVIAWDLGPGARWAAVSRCYVDGDEINPNSGGCLAMSCAEQHRAVKRIVWPDHTIVKRSTCGADRESVGGRSWLRARWSTYRRTWSAWSELANGLTSSSAISS